jgi:hypothetical protein
MFFGRYTFQKQKIVNGVLLPDGPPLVSVNRIPVEGQQALLEMICEASVADVSAGGNFYIGLCSENHAASDTLTEMAVSEPVGNGYARQAITRDATGWPTKGVTNDVRYQRTATVNFTSTGSYNVTITKAFLCNAASGTTGVLFSTGAPLATPLQITSAAPLATTYDLFVRG